MRIIDEKGKLFGLINVIDLFVLVIIVALVGFGAYKMVNVNPTVAVNNKQAVMRFEITEVRDYTYNVIQVGETVKDYDKNIVYGKVVKVEKTPAKRYVTTADGRVVVATVPDKLDVSIYVQGTATSNNNIILMGNNEIFVGASLALKGQKFTVRGTVLEVKFVE